MPTAISALKCELETVREIPHGRRSALGVDFYPDGRTMLGADQLGSLFTRPIFFDGTPYGGIDYLPHEAEVNRLKYIGQGEVLSVSDDGTAVVSHPGELQRHGVNVLMTVGPEARLAYSRSQDRFFVGDRGGMLRDERGNVLHTFDQPVNALALVSGDAQIACGLNDGTITIVDAADGSVVNTLKPKNLDEGSRAVNSIVEYEAPKGLVSGGTDNVLRFWSPYERTPQLEFDVVGRIPAVAVDESRQLAIAAGHSERIAAVDLRTGKEAFRLKASRATALAIDRKRSLLISGHGDSSIIVWDLSTRSKRATFRGHSSRVHSFAIRPDGDMLASSASDGTIRLWNLARLTEIGVAYQARPSWVVRDLTFARDNRSLYCVLSARDRRSLVLRIGGRREPLAGYEVSPRELDFPFCQSVKKLGEALVWRDQLVRVANAANLCQPSSQLLLDQDDRDSHRLLDGCRPIDELRMPLMTTVHQN